MEYGGATATVDAPRLNAGGGRIIEPGRLDPRRHAEGAKRAFQGLAENGDLAANIQGDTDVLGGSLFVPTGNDYAIGSESVPDVYTLPIFVPHTSFANFGGIGGATPSIGAGFVNPNGAVPASVFGYATIFLPLGVRITAMDMRATRLDAGDFARITVFRVDDFGVTTLLVSLTQTALGTLTTSAVLSEVVASRRYALQLELTSNAVATDAKFHYVLITYQKAKLRNSI